MKTIQVLNITGVKKAVLVERPLPFSSGEFAVVKVEIAPMCTEYK